MLPLRDDQRPARAPIVTLVVISACVAVFVRAGSVGLEELSSTYGLVPADAIDRFDRLRDAFPHVQLREVWRLLAPFLSSLFLHQDLMHLAGNLWFLWVFGPAVEGRFGSAVFGLFYFLCGIAAGCLHAWMTSGETVPRPGPFGLAVSVPIDTLPTIGASGAIAGVLGAYFILFPRARVATFFPPFFLFVVPAVVFLGLWFVGQYLAVNAIAMRVTGVAYGAHVGGFLAGMLLAVTAMVARPREFVR